jgi:hypothetical protein
MKLKQKRAATEANSGDRREGEELNDGGVKLSLSPGVCLPVCAVDRSISRPQLMRPAIGSTAGVSEGWFRGPVREAPADKLTAGRQTVRRGRLDPPCPISAPHGLRALHQSAVAG